MYDEVLSVAQVVASVLFLVGIGLIVKPAKTSSTKTLDSAEDNGKLVKPS